LLAPLRRGLIAIPCIVGHVSQLFIDAAIAARWAARPPDAAAEGAGRGSGAGKTSEPGSIAAAGGELVAVEEGGSAVLIPADNKA
jgi:hypothetical protein